MVAAGVSALSARLGAGTVGGGLLELRPGIVKDAVSLPTVLKQLAGSPQADTLITSLVAELKASLGVDVPPALIAAARANPERVVDMLVFSPQQMRAGFDALHAQHQARQAAGAPAKPAHTKRRELPQTWSTSTLSQTPYQRPAGDKKDLAPGLARGDVPNAKLSDAQAKQNTILAEVFDRLADNVGKPKAERFVVEHNGGRFTSLPHFMKALKADGYTIEAKITHRVADFFALKTTAPNGMLLDVPMAALVKTGVKDAAGHDAVVPAVHSEVVFTLKSSSSSKQPTLDGDVKWYQGVPNTGFFPCDVMRKSTWAGTTTAAVLDEAQATRALALCGVLSDVIQDVSARKGLLMAGYGVTGVCNDSVAIIQSAITGAVTAYPLFMRDDVLLPEIASRLKDANRADDGALKALQAAIGAVPSDDKPNPTSTKRALASIPWAPGEAPFASTEAARVALSGA